jgi:heme exporter protein B
MLKAACSFFYFELLLAFRRAQDWIHPISFFIILMLFFPLAFSPDPIFLQKHLAGCVWIAALFASILSLMHLFHTDLEEGFLEQLILSSSPFGLLLFAKLLAHWLLSALPLILLTPIIGILFHTPLEITGILALSLLLGTPILTFVGALGVALTLGLRQQSILLGLLILPLFIPVLIFCVSMVQQFQAGFSIMGIVAFLAGLCLLTLLFLPWAIAATLRIGLDD